MKTRGCQNREIRGRGGRWSSLSSSLLYHSTPTSSGIRGTYFEFTDIYDS